MESQFWRTKGEGGELFLAQTYLNIWSFLSHRCQLIINTGQLCNKVGFSFLPKLQIIGSCSLTSKYKIAGSHFKCHILSLQRSRAHLRNPAIVSDGQWHQQTAYCQHPGWQMTITMPQPPGIWAIWDPVSHSQLVPHLLLLAAAADSRLLLYSLHWQTQHEDSTVQFPGPGKSDRQPIPLGLSLIVKTIMRLNQGGPSICKQLHVQSVWYRDSLSAVKGCINHRMEGVREASLGKFSSQVWSSWQQLDFLL